MQGIRAWDYEDKEFYIEDNFNYILSVVKSLGEIKVKEADVYSAEDNNMEISEMLAVKSVQGTPKEDDSYEVLFREQIITLYYDLENPNSENGTKIYQVDEEKLEALIMQAKNQSAALFFETEEY